MSCLCEACLPRVSVAAATATDRLVVHCPLRRRRQRCPVRFAFRSPSAQLLSSHPVALDTAALRFPALDVEPHQGVRPVAAARRPGGARRSAGRRRPPVSAHSHTAVEGQRSSCRQERQLPGRVLGEGAAGADGAEAAVEGRRAATVGHRQRLQGRVEGKPEARLRHADLGQWKQVRGRVGRREQGRTRSAVAQGEGGGGEGRGGEERSRSLRVPVGQGRRSRERKEAATSVCG